MSNWNGKPGGTDRQRKQIKRTRAEARNVGGSVMQSCGHRHGPMQVSRCELTR